MTRYPSGEEEQSYEKLSVRSGEVCSAQPYIPRSWMDEDQESESDLHTNHPQMST